MTIPGRNVLLVPVLVCLSALAGCTSTEAPMGADKGKAGAGAERQLVDLEQDWVKAEANHDAAALRRILDDKFVSTFGAGEPLDKEGFIKAVTGGDPDPSLSDTLGDRTIRVDGDAAVVLGTDTVRRTKDGRQVTSVYRYTATYIKRQGRWVALAEHLVKVPQGK